MMTHIKEHLKDWIIKTGEKAVGIYDPIIPDELKEAVLFNCQTRSNKK